MPFIFEETIIPEVILVKPEKFEDKRGFFMETYKESEFKSAGIGESFVQDNHSRSEKNVLRGLHFQRPPRAQAKLVRCVGGKIFDVAVDIRQGSPTFGGWVGKKLTDKNNNILYIPTGFAHGFLTLSERAKVVYKVSDEYSPDSEGGIRWNDRQLDVDWPIEGEPIVSEKDQKLPSLKELKVSFLYEERS